MGEVPPDSLRHQSVLLSETMEWLRPRAGGIYVDATIGPGGHAERILELTEGRARVLGLDWDEDAVRRAMERLSRFGGSAEVICGNYASLRSVLDNRNIRGVDGILMDLGVSSLQLEDASRGFSFLRDGPLDMRMSRGSSRTAAELLRTLGERGLEELFRTYGEERRARRIAKAIGRRRGKHPARGTGPGDVWAGTRALAEFIEGLVGRRERIHPATRVFQALRIAVNGELDHLQNLLGSVDELLREGGRAVVLSFHSLEDRIVKRAFREKARAGTMRVLTRKPLRPSRGECRENPRARSAKLRVAERI